MAEQLLYLSGQQNKVLLEKWHEFFDVKNICKDANEIEVETLLEEFYSTFDRPKPLIFWCDSPGQLMYLPAIVQLAGRSNKFYELLPELAKKAGSHKWRALWQTAIDEIERAKIKFSDHPFTEYLNADKEDLSYLCWNVLFLFYSENKALHQGQVDIKNLLGDKFIEILNEDYRSRYPQTFMNVRHAVKNTTRLQNSDPVEEVLKHLSDFEIYRVRRILSREQDYAHTDIKVLKAKLSQGSNFGNNLWWGRWTLSSLFFYYSICDLFSDFKYDASKKAHRQTELFIDLAKRVFCINFYNEAAFVSRAPLSLSINENNQLHCVDGPAIKFRDGSEINAFYNIPVPKEIVKHPELLTAKYIQAHPNAEVRRVLLRHYGEDNFIQDLNAREIQSDQFGKLFRIELVDDEALVMVKVENSTPETDGSYKSYYLRVPPDIESARDAVAWTFNLSEQEYAPEVET